MECFIEYWNERKCTKEWRGMEKDKNYLELVVLLNRDYKFTFNYASSDAIARMMNNGMT